MNLPIIVGGVIWLGASITSQVIHARACRLLTPEQQAEVENLTWEMYLFTRFLRLDLLIVFIVVALMWSGAAIGVSLGFMVAMMGTIVLSHVATVRRVQRLGLPRQYVKADQRSRMVRSAGLCVLLILPFAYAVLSRA